MKFAAVLALAAGAMAFKNETVVYTTEVVTAVTTYCPGPTTITHGENTYTVTEATTLTISDCPCTIKVPVTTISSVVCNNCPPAYHNSTSAAPPAVSTPVGTVSLPPVPVPTTTATSPPIETAGAGRAVALSGGALAGVLGLAAFVL
ncbi:hypothetical protein F5144DRAFT_597300 [Chaetomium tenue]|uniref:Uncharacterized protein n=1 Tax=Chaetomium tenue TaxID=1854479 RepID=A0ACB7PKY4_9PEZI|nr:hypothetical protein F5144DRAFT_597300 [Chaetomium globosum]